MVSCPFCRKKIWHQKRLSNTFKQGTFTVYWCGNCKLFIKIIKEKLEHSPHEVVEITTEAYNPKGRKQPDIL